MAAAEQTSDEEADVAGKAPREEQRALQLDFAKIVRELQKEGAVAPSRRFMRMVRDEASYVPQLSSLTDVGQEGSIAPVGTITRLVEDVLAYCRALILSQGDNDPEESVAFTIRRLRLRCAEDYGQLLLASSSSRERDGSPSLRSSCGDSSPREVQRGNKNADSCTSLARSALSTASLATEATSRSPKSSPRERIVAVEGCLEMSLSYRRRTAEGKRLRPRNDDPDMSWVGLRPKVIASLSEALISFPANLRGEVYAVVLKESSTSSRARIDGHRTAVTFRVRLGDEERAGSLANELREPETSANFMDTFTSALSEKAGVVVTELELKPPIECPSGSLWQRGGARTLVHHLQDPLYSAHAAFFESLYALVIRAVQQGLRGSFEAAAARGGATKGAAQQLAARTEEELGRLFRSDAFSKAFAVNGQHRGGSKAVAGVHAEDESAQQAARAEEDIGRLLRSFTDTRTKLLRNVDNLDAKITQAVQQQADWQVKLGGGATRFEDTDKDGKRDAGGVSGGGGGGGQEANPKDGEPSVPNSVDKLIARFRARAPPRNRRSAEHRQAMRTVCSTRSPVMAALLSPPCGDSRSRNSWRNAEGARDQTWASASLS